MSGPVRVGVIDSGVYAAHPHIGGVAGGVAITRDGRLESDFVDRLGHGTAVAAVIREKAPDALIFAVKIFHDRLATGIHALVLAIEWCAENGMHLVNLSVGTSNPAHEPALREAIASARTRSAALVAAYEDAGVPQLPGCLPGVTPVLLDWACPRDGYRKGVLPDGRTVFYASGFPRPIPGVPEERNLKGVSFAVANVTGLLAKACEDFSLAAGVLSMKAPERKFRPL